MKLIALILLTAAAAVQGYGQVPIYGGSELGTGDNSGAIAASPFKVGTTLPATCVVGQSFFKSDATAGQNIYACTATDTWTQQGGAGARSVVLRFTGGRTGINGNTELQGDMLPDPANLPTRTVQMDWPYRRMTYEFADLQDLQAVALTFGLPNQAGSVWDSATDITVATVLYSTAASGGVVRWEATTNNITPGSATETPTAPESGGQTAVDITLPAAADTLAVGAMVIDKTNMAAGDFVAVEFRRLGNHVNDTSTFTTRLVEVNVIFHLQ